MIPEDVVPLPSLNSEVIQLAPQDRGDRRRRPCRVHIRMREGRAEVRQLVEDQTAKFATMIAQSTNRQCRDRMPPEIGSTSESPPPRALGQPEFGERV
jgi:hypothetical protein